MQSSSTLPSSWRIPTLDGARSRGIYVQFYDPDGRRYGIPTYPYHWAPKHLYTARHIVHDISDAHNAAQRPEDGSHDLSRPPA